MKHLKLSSIFFLFFCLSNVNHLSAQVTIGSGEVPERATILDMKSQKADANNVTSTKGGLGLPRVMLVNKTTLEPFIPTSDTDWTNASTTKIKEKHAGLMVYNIYVSPDAETVIDKKFRQGIYVWDGGKWVPETKDETRYFHIPSFNISFAATGTGKTCDLYEQYAKQFTKTGNTSFVSSNAALTTVPSPTEGKLYARTELDYAITYYDTNILENITIDANGVMAYDVKSVETTPNSYINVVFIIK